VQGVTAEFLVSSIDGLTATGNVSKEFVACVQLLLRRLRRMPGFFPCARRCCPSRWRVDLRNLARSLILLPVVGNAAEHVTALVVARKNKLDLSLAVAVGSSLQIALFVIPVLVLLAWCIGQPLDLEFDSFETLLVFLTVCVVNWGASSAFPRSNALILNAFPTPCAQPLPMRAQTGWKAPA
jgi:Ca2+:H+ antiporter